MNAPAAGGRGRPATPRARAGGGGSAAARRWALVQDVGGEHEVEGRAPDQLVGELQSSSAVSTATPFRRAFRATSSSASASRPWPARRAGACRRQARQREAAAELQHALPGQRHAGELRASATPLRHSDGPVGRDRRPLDRPGVGQLGRLGGLLHTQLAVRQLDRLGDELLGHGADSSAARSRMWACELEPQRPAWRMLLAGCGGGDKPSEPPPAAPASISRVEPGLPGRRHDPGALHLLGRGRLAAAAVVGSVPAKARELDAARRGPGRRQLRPLGAAGHPAAGPAIAEGRAPAGSAGGEERLRRARLGRALPARGQGRAPLRVRPLRTDAPLGLGEDASAESCTRRWGPRPRARDADGALQPLTRR